MPLDPFRGYANAIRDELPDAIAVLDAFHVVRLGTQVVDEVRRRVQQQTLEHRGLKDDALYRIRGLLRHGANNLTPRQRTRLETGLRLGDPHGEVDLAWQCYQQLRAAYRAKLPVEGRRIAMKIIDTWRTCPVPEIARLGRTLRQWRQQVLAYFSTNGVSNGGTEAINLLIEKTRRPLTASATSATTGYASCLSPTPPAHTATGRTTLRSEEPAKALQIPPEYPPL
jgi:transposase